MADNRATIRPRITNSLTEARILMLEPWAGKYPLPPGKSLDVVAEGDLKQPIEIEVAPDRIIVYGFDSTYTMLTALDGDRELRSNPSSADP